MPAAFSAAAPRVPRPIASIAATITQTWKNCEPKYAPGLVMPPLISNASSIPFGTMSRYGSNRAAVLTTVG